MGFIEETGAAQYYRDARILTIYEGTTAIQANDLIGRKTSRATAARRRADFVGADARDRERARPGRRRSARRSPAACGPPSAPMRRSIDYVVRQFKGDIRGVYAGSVPYLKLAGIVHGGWQMARAALAAQRLVDGWRDDPDFHRAKIGDGALFRRPHARDGGGARRSRYRGQRGNPCADRSRTVLSPGSSANTAGFRLSVDSARL